MINPTIKQIVKLCCLTSQSSRREGTGGESSARNSFTKRLNYSAVTKNKSTLQHARQQTDTGTIYRTRLISSPLGSGINEGRRMKYIVFSIIIGCNLLLSQTSNSNEGSPEIGWDSLKSLIKYPEIARRAGVQGNASVMVEIDSLGNAVDVIVCAYEILQPAIINVAKKIKWIPRSHYGRSLATTSYFEIEFKLKEFNYMPKKRVLTIEGAKPSISRDH